jgi:low affinity Fe/Cu permease
MIDLSAIAVEHTAAARSPAHGDLAGRAYLDWVTADWSPMVSEAFRRVAAAAAAKFGTPWAFTAALVVVVAWAATGPLFGFSETWQLVINTGTTIVTFLMVFLIQATQNRDAKAIQLKLDELIRSSAARNEFADLEDASEAELEAFQSEFEQLRRKGVHADQAAARAHGKLRRPHRAAKLKS